LGLSVNSNLVLEDSELQALRIQDPNLPVDDSIRVALAARFDYLNVRDELQDAERKVALAANFLKPRVDLDADVGFASRQGSSFRAPDPSRYTYSAGLKVDPGLDRVAERNAYRSTLIARDRVARDLAQQEDDIKLQVRDSWRTLDQARRSYEISEIGVKIAERRVEEQNLLAELGRARAQDQVDAQNALNDSKNQRTQALITHTNARLQFWNRLGILYIKDNGQWEETQDAKAQPAH
ncbi:MAG TPA: TolC family protein, partial [Candidatus Sulfotelmatobacter sp.]|nr:TolC family protein [Candidatus Sulfotelmatobacter sp.]